MTDEPDEAVIAEKPVHTCRDYRSNNPTIILKDTMAAVVLGAVTVVLLVSLLRALARNRRLEGRLAGLADVTED